MNTIDRRDFLARSVALAGGSVLPFSNFAQAEPRPETKRIRLAKYPVACVAPIHVAEALLRTEGFTDIDYVEGSYAQGEPAVGPNKADFDLDSAHGILTYVDARRPAVTLAGIHLGCYELFGSQRVRSIRELKGKRVPVEYLGDAKHVLLSSMAAYVGVDPRREINWIVVPLQEGLQQYERGEVDAFLGFPPEPQILRAKKVGPVIVNTATDKPWSQYFCCMLLGNSEFVRKYPVATKRAVRAILKAADICAADPKSVARMLTDRKLADRYEYALETLRDVRFDVWRSYDPEDALRFHANRLHEVGMIKTPPNKLIAQGTDWRFLNKLKKELKA
jgi:NitT/TauT family transport system substrate-binding protein